MLTWKNAKRIVVIVFGLTVLLVGIAMLVLPGPAFVVIPLGLAILASEFVWARRLLQKARDSASGFPVVYSVLDKALSKIAGPEKQDTGTRDGGPTAGSGTASDSSRPAS